MEKNQAEQEKNFDGLIETAKKRFENLEEVFKKKIAVEASVSY